MNAYYRYLNSLVNKNKQEFGNYENINWINLWNTDELEATKQKLIRASGGHTLFKGTKPYVNQISDGCKICGAGNWSCLFITGKCNANCFYCPSSQTQDEPPESQGITFHTPAAYAEYINYFGFKGVSFSGGEPLLVKDRVMQYLKAIRSLCDPEIYTWMYTNGILSDEKVFRELADNGLNEIRFDIGATNYNLKGIKKAKGLIPNITVEIPAIPEEKERLMKLLPEMINAGVTNLNLHQLRLTHHNADKLLKHEYTYIPAERPIVLESELAALEIMAYAKEAKLPIGINYCSFYFKYRFQKAGYRKILANKLKHPDDFITEKGFLRKRNGTAVNYEGLTLYDENKPKAAIETDNLVLKHKTYGVHRSLAKRVDVDDRDQIAITDLLTGSKENIPERTDLFDLWQYEFIEKGLREY